MQAIIVEDGLASNGPHAGTLMENDFRYIPGAKPRDHKLPVRRFEAGETKETWVRRDMKTGAMRRFEWDSNLPPDDGHFDLKVNMPKLVETSGKGKTTTFARVTDLRPDRSMAGAVMRCARRRWTIENETFKTLKSRDMYNFEHNYGHGNNHLCDVFGVLAMLSFLIDQVQQSCCGMFRRALRHQERNLYLWDDLRSLVHKFAFPDWETLYMALSGEIKFALVRDGP